MALRYSFDAGDEAARLEAAVEKVLADGLRTADLLGPEGGTPVSTAAMGDAIVAALDAGTLTGEMPAPAPSNARGAAFALIAFGIYSTHDVVVKFLGGVYSPFQIVFFSTLFGFPIVTIMLMRDRDRRQPAPAPPLVDAAAHRLRGALHRAGLLRLLGPAAGADLRDHLRGAAAHHAPGHPDPRRARRLAPLGWRWRSGSSASSWCCGPGRPR